MCALRSFNLQHTQHDTLIQSTHTQVSDPSVLFLDEPTSGLDSTTSYELVSALHALAENGTNVIAVLHQPSYQLYQMFTKVLLLGKGGRTVYLGLSEDALNYFEKDLNISCPEFMNPADYFMDCIALKLQPEDNPSFAAADLYNSWKSNGEQ